MKATHTTHPVIHGNIDDTDTTSSSSFNKELSECNLYSMLSNSKNGKNKQ